MPWRLSSLAERDLEEIWLYIAGDASLATADRLIDVIVDRFDLLAERPRMGRLRPEFGAGVRSFTVESHVIYYRYDRDVLIARVLHGRRDQAAAWSSLNNPTSDNTVATAPLSTSTRGLRSGGAATSASIGHQRAPAPWQAAYNRARAR